MVWDCEFAAADFLVAAGWDLRHEYWLHLPGVTDEQEDYHRKLLEHTHRPSPLCIVCRNSVRDTLRKATFGREILSRIDKLPLPNKVKDFLKLNDIG